MSWTGRFDLGLANYLDGDGLPPERETTPLLRGRPVVVLRADSPLAGQEAVRTTDLLAEPLIVMRSGYVMHRYLHRLLQGRPRVLLLDRRGRYGQAHGGRGGWASPDSRTSA